MPVLGPLARRVLYMAGGWGGVGIAYAFGCGFAGQAVAVPAVALDRALAFHPAAIWVYLSFFAFVPYAYLRAPDKRLPWLALAMQVCAIVSAVAYAWCPTTTSMTVGASVAPPLAWLVQFDTPANCLPSLHAALAVLCAAALYDGRKPGASAGAIAWAVAICWSALALRRHMVIDLGAGMVLGAACGIALLPTRQWRYR